MAEIGDNDIFEDNEALGAFALMIEEDPGGGTLSRSEISDMDGPTTPSAALRGRAREYLLTPEADFELNDSQVHESDDEDLRQLMSELNLSEDAPRALAELPQPVENAPFLASYESDAPGQAIFHDIEAEDDEVLSEASSEEPAWIKMMAGPTLEDTSTIVEVGKAIALEVHADVYVEEEQTDVVRGVLDAYDGAGRSGWATPMSEDEARTSGLLVLVDTPKPPGGPGGVPTSSIISSRHECFTSSSIHDCFTSTHHESASMSQSSLPPSSEQRLREFAIVDTGCTSTVVGENVLNQFWERARSVVRREIDVSFDSSRLKKFRFADLKVHQSLCLATVPILLCGKEGTLETSVVPGSTPFLLSIVVLSRLGALIDFVSREVMFTKICRRSVYQLPRASNGHLLLPLLSEWKLIRILSRPMSFMPMSNLMCGSSQEPREGSPPSAGTRRGPHVLRTRAMAQPASRVVSDSAPQATAASAGGAAAGGGRCHVERICASTR